MQLFNVWIREPNSTCVRNRVTLWSYEYLILGSIQA